MRKRLRPAYSPTALRRLYPRPHDHRRWPDHIIRVEATILATAWLCAQDGNIQTAADLSCGNGTILQAAPVEHRIFGDFAPGYAITGPIEETIRDLPNVDMFICSETIEHLDDPDTALEAIHAKSRTLVLSTPVDCWDDDNPEHYWAWDREGVDGMLDACGFRTILYLEVDPKMKYRFGVWAAGS